MTATEALARALVMPTENHPGWMDEFSWHRQEDDLTLAQAAAPFYIARLAALGYEVRPIDVPLPDSWVKNGGRVECPVGCPSVLPENWRNHVLGNRHRERVRIHQAAEAADREAADGPVLVERRDSEKGLDPASAAADLRRLAEAATPGPWEFGPGDENTEAGVVTQAGVFRMGVTNRYHDAAYIAAASPDAILGLLDSQRDWQEAAQEYERMLAIMVERHDRLRAALTHAHKFANRVYEKSQYGDAIESDILEVIHATEPEQARAALAAGEGE